MLFISDVMYEIFYSWWDTDAFGERELWSDCAGAFYSYEFASALVSELDDACLYLINDDGSRTELPSPR